jgi:hypothetical protein
MQDEHKKSKMTCRRERDRHVVLGPIYAGLQVTPLLSSCSPPILVIRPLEQGRHFIAEPRLRGNSPRPPWSPPVLDQ